MAVEYRCCETGFFIRLGIVALLVLFAGMMSGLTLGLMSMSLVELEVIIKSGTPSDSKHAAKILPVVRRQHLLLCTLLIGNAAAMETLPIFLDSLVPAWGAIIISVTLILLFGEILPQAVCTRYGLAIGAALAPVVQILVWICFPVAYPISKAGKGGELTRDETMIIAGALELTEKTARDAMTHISETFAIDINAKLDRDLMKLILEQGHSRVPVYYEQPINIIGLILVKNLLTIHPTDEVPVKNVTIRKIPRVSETMPLYDILNEFQKGHSHMAVVVRDYSDTAQSATENRTDVRDVRLDIHGERHPQEKILKSRAAIKKLKNVPSDGNSNKGLSKNKKWSKDFHPEVLHISDEPLPNFTKEGEAIGIITMEDVIEEIIKEEIYDETDNRDIR
ncbi:DUF21 domain-containing protein At2g14520-like isoform X2 [Carya illinoinensis]|uniref:CNNM transmembrane domain-containing protein n=1 Tax=Carya illinoinensis TaxID=32201 RepID=A0A8T1PRQ7_CARIL|nr:DUF21 domain-containing protein At2g14520-like isoform X2 [Carya illinoinensis]KAG6646856.1 hypothetical protein CIPAW_07G037100 [Carya illinoinensis]